MNIRCGGLMLLYMVDSKALVCWGDGSSCFFFFCFPYVRERDWFTRNREIMDRLLLSSNQLPPTGKKRRNRSNPIRIQPVFWDGDCWCRVCMRTERPAENKKKAAEKQDSESTCPWWSMKGRRLVGWTDPDLFMRWTLRLSQNSAAVSTLASSAPSRGWRNVRWEIIKYLTKKLRTEGQISNELELEPNSPPSLGV